MGKGPAMKEHNAGKKDLPLVLRTELPSLKNVKNQPHFLLRVTRTPLNTQRNRQVLLKVLNNAEAAKQLFVAVVSIRKGQFAVNKYEKVFFFKCLRYSFFSSSLSDIFLSLAPPVVLIFLPYMCSSVRC